MDSGSPAHPARSRVSFLQGWVAATVLVIAVVIAYANSISAPFVFDDLGAVQRNPTIRELWSWQVLQPPNDGSTTTGRPLLNLSYAINYAWDGLSVRGFHVGNVLIHAGSTLLLAGLVRMTLRRVRAVGELRPAISPRTEVSPDLIAMFAGLVWALHPLQTESVTGVAQRSELLCGFFYLLTCYSFARGTQECSRPGDARGPVAPGWLGLSVAACAAGMAAKEVMVTAPVMVLLYDRTFVAGSFSAAWGARRRFHLALGSTWLLLAFLVFNAAGARGASAGLGLGVTSWDYLLTQSRALLIYLKLSIWPSPLVLDYGTGVAHSVAEVGWHALVVLTLLSITIWGIIVRPLLGFAGAWFFVILAPSSSVVPLVTQTIAEHRMYLPLAGLTTLAVVALARWWRRGAVVALVIGTLVFAALTIARNHDYLSAKMIWADTVQKYPSNARAHNNLGLELQREGDLAGAIVQYREAVLLDPRYVPGFYDLGTALLLAGKPGDAVASLTEAVRLAPDHGDAQLALGNALVQAGRPADAIAPYRAALALNPAADGHYNLGVALQGTGNDAEAASEFETALKINPSLAIGYYQLGRMAERHRDAASAVSFYSEALRVVPDHQESHRRLGLIAARQEDFVAAASHFAALVRIDAKDADAWANLGNATLARGRVPEALEDYAEALRLRPDDPRMQENLRLARESVSAP